MRGSGTASVSYPANVRTVLVTRNSQRSQEAREPKSSGGLWTIIHISDQIRL